VYLVDVARSMLSCSGSITNGLRRSGRALCQNCDYDNDVTWNRILYVLMRCVNCVTPLQNAYTQSEQIITRSSLANGSKIAYRQNVNMTPTWICRFSMVILACSVLYLYLHFCTDDVFSFCRFLQLFLQLLYCLDVCIVSGQLVLLH